MFSVKKYECVLIKRRMRGDVLRVVINLLRRIQEKLVGAALVTIGLNKTHSWQRKYLSDHQTGT
jgi:ABC-type phosphate/phosphonate transport system ATPase subunit